MIETNKKEIINFKETNKKKKIKKKLKKKNEIMVNAIKWLFYLNYLLN